MSAQAEAERERRAKIISAKGELQAASSLAEAADKMTRNKVVFGRYFQSVQAPINRRSKL